MTDTFPHDRWTGKNSHVPNGESTEKGTEFMCPIANRVRFYMSNREPAENSKNPTWPAANRFVNLDLVMCEEKDSIIFDHVHVYTASHV